MRALTWPEVNDATSYAEPFLKVRKCLLARYRPDDDSLLLLDVPSDEREHLLEILPDVFLCEPHYENHDIVLAKMENATVVAIEHMLERR
jgi:hypothetical protein